MYRALLETQSASQNIQRANTQVLSLVLSEGKEGRAVVRPTAEKQNARPSFCLLLKVRMQKVLLSSEEGRRDLELT